jgi:H+/Cl- antiporter ClcA
MKKLSACVTGALLAAPLIVHAHEGHGLPGVSHWHATDVLGFVAVALVAGAVAWWDRRDR